MIQLICMIPLRTRERLAPSSTPTPSFPLPPSKEQSSLSRPIRLETVTKRPIKAATVAPLPRPTPPVHRAQVEKQLHQPQTVRVQRELKEMQETEDLNEIDDDVEDLATLYDWQADEHNHHPKSPMWYVALAAGTTVVTATLLFMANIIGALTIALIGGFIYYIAQRKPQLARYRILVDGIAINNLLYHYRDLAAFNIIYVPGETKTVILRSQHVFSPLLHMEIGDADPVAIRDLLLEFIPEDQDMMEPIVDVVARRLKF